jgi:hypothetical protein
MTVEEDVAALQARVSALESGQSAIRARVSNMEAVGGRLRAALVALWRKTLNRSPSQEEF